MVENPHILVVTTDPDDPEEFRGVVECHDPERTHCKLWFECRACRNTERAEHAAGGGFEQVIHGEVHHVYEGMLMTDSGQCISAYDDGPAAADEAADDIGLTGRWYVDVEWCEGLIVNAGGHPERAPEEATGA
ncbi:hypothetical protein CRM73_00315 [Kocuria sp. CCUG 69068]|uniref:hypothetical protein n=1 Tax=Kocuria sp. CCUG 69068 TaxID=2043138 RepID=UPI001E2A4C44|nr:hypothetical protein [Kocuria sp. CCUG 69068]